MNKLYQKFASELSRLDSDRPKVCEDAEYRIEVLEQSLPSGAGFNSGTEFLAGESSDNKLVFRTEFHHTSEHGSHLRWTEHKVIVTPDFRFGFDLRVTGRNYRYIKEYITEVFQCALDSEA
jgi:hypothetical protein